MTAALPIPGPNDVWGGLLNTWLLIAHNADGTLRNGPGGVNFSSATGAGQVPVTDSASTGHYAAAATRATATPTADTTGGAAGNSGTYADGAHTHPVSTLYDRFGQDSVNFVSASGSAQTIPDTTTSQTSYVVLNSNCLFAFPTAAVGKRFDLIIAQDVTGSRVPSFPANVGWAGGTAPTWSTTSKAVDWVRFRCVDGTNWFAESVSLGMVVPPPPITIVQQANLSGSGSATQITLAQTPTAGNCILLIIGVSTSALPANPGGGGVTWTQIATDADSQSESSAAAPYKMEIWLGTNATGAGGTSTITFNQTFLGHIFELDASTVDGAAVTGSGNATSGSPYTAPTATSPRNGDAVFTLFMSANDNIAVPGAPWNSVKPFDIRIGANTFNNVIAWQLSTTGGLSYTPSVLGQDGTSRAVQSITFFVKQ